MAMNAADRAFLDAWVYDFEPGNPTKDLPARFVFLEHREHESGYLGVVVGKLKPGSKAADVNRSDLQSVKDHVEDVVLVNRGARLFGALRHPFGTTKDFYDSHQVQRGVPDLARFKVADAFGYEVARRYALRLGLPMEFIGYSLGAPLSSISSLTRRTNTGTLRDCPLSAVTRKRR